LLDSACKRMRMDTRKDTLTDTLRPLASEFVEAKVR
jgi:hypothetical protein